MAQLQQRRSSARLLVLAAALALLAGGGSVSFAGPQQRSLRAGAPATALSAEPPEKGAAAPLVEETEANGSIGAAGVGFVAGLLFPIIHGLPVALVFAGLGYAAASGALKDLVAKQESTKDYVEVAETVGDLAVKAGMTAVKGVNFVKEKVDENSK